MKILVGDTRSGDLLEQIKAQGWGRMFAESNPTPFEGEPWGFDNGAFSAWLNGQPFPADRYRIRLDGALRNGLTPYLAVVPDLVGRGQESLEFSLGWLEQLPTTWPWYLAVQDGMDPAEVESELVNFHGIFLGGTTRFKSTAGQWREIARRHHKRFHYARAGTPSRIQHAVAVEADSLDSSFPLWTNERFRAFVAEIAAPASPLLPVVKAWMRGLYEFDALGGCAP
jgi:hypothetical protein